MQCLKKQAGCSIRDLEYDLSFSPNVICGVMNGKSYNLVYYETIVQYLLEEIGWTVDISGVREMIRCAFEKDMPLAIGIIDRDGILTNYRLILTKDKFYIKRDIKCKQ